MCWQCHKRAPMPWNPQIQEVICLACVWCVSSAFEWSIHGQPLKELALLFRGDGSQVVCTHQIVSYCCWGSAEAVLVEIAGGVNWAAWNRLVPISSFAHQLWRSHAGSESTVFSLFPLWLRAYCWIHLTPRSQMWWELRQMMPASPPPPRSLNTRC